jgi:hypothetical protein
MRTSSGQISCGTAGHSPSSSSSCGVALDWLEDDTLLVVASIPVWSTVDIPLSSSFSSLHSPVPFNPVTSPATPHNSTSSKGKTQKSSTLQGTRNLFDLAFTALTVPDLFTGGYSTFEAGASRGDPGSQCVSPMYVAVEGSPRVSVLRNVTSDLTGMRCIPSTASSPFSSSKDEDDMPKSAMVHTESLILALTFPSGRSKRAMSQRTFFKPAVQVTELEAVYCDSVHSKSHFLSVDVTHWMDEGATAGSDIGLQGDLSADGGSSSEYAGPAYKNSLAVHSHPRDSTSTARENVLSAKGNGTYVLTQPHSVVAGVDSLGHLRMGVIPHSALLISRPEEGSNSMRMTPLCGVNAQMPAQCNSGTFRTLALSTRSAAHSSSSAPCTHNLVMGSTSVMVNVFSVVIVATPSTPSPAFHLSLLYRVNALFVPAYLLSLNLQPITETDDNNPNVLVIGTKGDVGFLSGKKSVTQCNTSQSFSNTGMSQIMADQSTDNYANQSYRNSTFLSLHSALLPLHHSPPLLSTANTPSSALYIATCSAARVIAVLQKGTMQLLHADSGLQVTSSSCLWCLCRASIHPTLYHLTLLL